MHKFIANHKCKGFLIIELLVALGLLALFAGLISKYQLQVRLHKKAAEQLYMATNLCEDMVEELWAGKQPLEDTKLHSIGKTINDITITTTVTPGPVKSFYDVLVVASWRSALGQNQKINLDVICVC